MAHESKAPQVKLRIPEDLHAHLKERAVSNRRSLNGEVTVRLEQSRQAETKPVVPK